MGIKELPIVMIIPPFQGLGIFMVFLPRALPWADILCPFRARRTPAYKMVERNGIAGGDGVFMDPAMQDGRAKQKQI